MKSRTCLVANVSVLALAGAISLSATAVAHPVYRPTGIGIPAIDPNMPVPHVGPYEAPYLAPTTKSGKWTDVSGKLPFTAGPWAPMQLTDGTVIIQDYCTSPNQWYKLTPDSKGNYATGTWSKIATLPAGYSPLYYAQQVLPDGDVIVNGGEYNDCNNVWTNMGAMYDPVTNAWTSVSGPSGWASIGDAESVILPDGSYYLADCCSTAGTGEAALGTISGTKVSWSSKDTWQCSSSTYACMYKEDFTSLPDGDVLLVDVWDYGSNYDDYWIYDTSTNTWSDAGKTADYLSSTSTNEIGPTPLTPQGPKGGTVIQFSANTSLGVNDVYSVANGTWSSGPVMKYESKIYDCADAPAATLPDGNVFVQADPGAFNTPSHFWEFSVSSKGAVTATQVSDPKQAPSTSSYEGNMLVLPTGQVLWDNSQVIPNEVSIYTPKGKAKGKWLPKVSSVQTTLTVGSTGNAISGTNFNGWDLGGMYGAYAQAATNFPLVRITNTSTGDVCYARSYNFSTMGVWTKGTTNATFDIPSTCETGASTLQVITNGIASKGVSVTLDS
jgi:hypothetical protein